MSKFGISWSPEIKIGQVDIGPRHPPFVIAEIGINHNGDVEKAVQMIDDAKNSGCKCVKFQCHIINDEMIPNDVIPGNATESIWDIMTRCALNETEERYLKRYVEKQGMIYLSTPFSRAAADRLQSLGVVAFKIGSGECNNYPLVRHIAAYKKPVILSTGMNDIASIRPAVDIFVELGTPFALLHCVSLYPASYEHVSLGALGDLRDSFPNTVIGLSDHSLGNYMSFAAVAVGGGSILEKHFTSSHNWPGPDISISILPHELADLIRGSKAIYSARGGKKSILSEEQPTIDFAYASVVTIDLIRQGEQLTSNNVWVKRPGTGQIQAKDYGKVLKKTARENIPIDTQITWDMLND
jgi:N-acetylneuraminate synthase